MNKRNIFKFVNHKLNIKISLPKYCSDSCLNIWLTFTGTMECSIIITLAPTEENIKIWAPSKGALRANH